MVRVKGRKPTKTLWIFCEGKTEKLYFDKLRCIERINRLKIKSFKSGHKNADGIINEAIAFIKRRSNFQKGDLVACIFDRNSNNNEQLSNAKSKADSERIIISFSNPCFEYWILCHHGYFPSPFEKDNIISKISEKSGNDYENADSELYLKTRDKISNASSNAEKIKNKHSSEGTNLISTESNPLTLVFELIKVIDSFKT